MGRFLFGEAVVVVPARLAGPLWLLLDDALSRSRREGRGDLEEFDELVRDLMAADLAREPRAADVARSCSSDIGSSVDSCSSAGDMVSVAQAARMLGVSDRRVRQLLDGGQLTGTRLGRVRLVDVASIEERRRTMDAQAAS